MTEYVRPWDDHEQRQVHERRFRTQNFRIISIDDVDVGIVAVEVRDQAFLLNQLYILPQHQGSGIGYETMLIVKDEAACLGLPVRFRVMKANHGAKRFYERLGFVEVGETDSHCLYTSS